jgi:hypothetical protein
MSNTNDAFGATADKASKLGDDVAQRAAQIKERVSDIARGTADAVDERRSTAADGIETAASTLRDKAGSLPGGETVNRAASAAADRLTTTADYVRTHDVTRMLSDVGLVVKNNPGLALLAAAAFGFVVGRATRND